MFAIGYRGVVLLLAFFIIGPERQAKRVSRHQTRAIRRRGRAGRLFQSSKAQVFGLGERACAEPRYKLGAATGGTTMARVLHGLKVQRRESNREGGGRAGSGRACDGPCSCNGCAPDHIPPSRKLLALEGTHVASARAPGGHGVTRCPLARVHPSSRLPRAHSA